MPTQRDLPEQGRSRLRPGNAHDRPVAAEPGGETFPDRVGPSKGLRHPLPGPGRHWANLAGDFPAGARSGGCEGGRRRGSGGDRLGPSDVVYCGRERRADCGNEGGVGGMARHGRGLQTRSEASLIRRRSVAGLRVAPPFKTEAQHACQSASRSSGTRHLATCTWPGWFKNLATEATPSRRNWRGSIQLSSVVADRSTRRPARSPGLACWK